MRVIFLFFSVYYSSCCITIAQERATLETYSFEDTTTKTALSNLPMAVFLYTDWCRFCNAMKQNTFTDPQVIQQLNTDYYYIPFNAEHKEPVTIKGKIFNFKPSGNNQGMHELAKALTAYQQKPTFPSFLIINKDMEILYEQSGFIDATTMNQILKTVRLEYSR
jgi:thioredoxin-related protein